MSRRDWVGPEEAVEDIMLELADTRRAIVMLLLLNSGASCRNEYDMASLHSGLLYLELGCGKQAAKHG